MRHGGELPCLRGLQAKARPVGEKRVQKCEQMLVLIYKFVFSRVKISYDYATEMRRLLRFTAAIANIGSADFRWK